MKEKYYTIYQTTNLINNFIYIGFHVTNNINDCYLGSGHLIKKAILEFGRMNFKKEILFIFDNKDEMLAKEKELVNSEFLSRPDVYNISPGGASQGTLGLKFTQEHKEKIGRGNLGKTQTEETKQLIRDKRKLQTFSEETRKKMGLASKNRIRGPRSQETIEKISNSNKGKSKPPRTKEHCENLSKSNKGKLPPRERVERVMASKKGKSYPLVTEHLRKLARERTGKSRPIETTEKIRKSKVIKKVKSLLFGIIIFKQDKDS